MENHKLVMPEHLNQYGFLFGGNLLKWVDEYAYIAARTEYPGRTFVTVAMDRVEFRKSVRQGTILVFAVERTREGRTSVTYAVNVYNAADTARAESLFSTNVTFVRVDEGGGKVALRT